MRNIMRNRGLQFFAAVILGFALVSACQAADYFLQAGEIYPQFRLEGTGIVVWGSAISNATGFARLVAEESAETPFETIRAWYATMLAAKLADREVRICYDEGTGMITSVIPR